MIHTERHSPADVRRRLRRFADVGLIASWALTPEGYEVTTTGGDVETFTEDAAWPFLSGLSAGAWAEKRKAGQRA